MFNFLIFRRTCVFWYSNFNVKKCRHQKIKIEHWIKAKSVKNNFTSPRLLSWTTKRRVFWLPRHKRFLCKWAFVTSDVHFSLIYYLHFDLQCPIVGTMYEWRWIKSKMSNRFQTFEREFQNNMFSTNKRSGQVTNNRHWTKWANNWCKRFLKF